MSMFLDFIQAGKSMFLDFIQAGKSMFLDFIKLTDFLGFTV